MSVVMNKRGGGRTMMFLGIVLALIAAALVFAVINGSRGSHANQAMATVVVAAGNVPANTQFSATNLSTYFVQEQAPQNLVPAGAVPFAQLQMLAGHTTIVPLTKGEIVVFNTTSFPEAAVAQSTNSPSADARIKNGYVVMAIKASNDVGFQKNDTVDVLGSLKVAPDSGALKGVPFASTQTVLQNVTVFAVDQPVKGTVLLLLSHQDALTMKYLQENGTVDLVLRRAGDNAPVSTSAVDGAFFITHYDFLPPS